MKTLSVLITGLLIFPAASLYAGDPEESHKLMGSMVVMTGGAAFGLTCMNAPGAIPLALVSSFVAALDTMTQQDIQKQKADSVKKSLTMAKPDAADFVLGGEMTQNLKNAMHEARLFELEMGVDSLSGLSDESLALGIYLASI